MKDTKKDIYSSQAYTIVVSLVAYILSICAIAHIYPREETSFDYLGLIIGVLSLLVTVLIGWQIAQAYISKDKIQDIELKIHDIDSAIDNKTNHAIHLNLYHIFYFQGVNSAEKNDYSFALDYLFHSLDCASKCGIANEQTNEIIIRIKEILEDEKIKVNLHSKDRDRYKKIIRTYSHSEEESIISHLDDIPCETTSQRTSEWYTDQITNDNSFHTWHSANTNGN